MNNNATAQKITLDDLNPETIERLFNVLQDAKNELYQNHTLQEVVCNGDKNIERIWDLQNSLFTEIIDHWESDSSVTLHTERSQKEEPEITAKK